MEKIIITSNAKVQYQKIKDFSNYGIVYGHKNKKNKKWYIGVSMHPNNPEKRWLKNRKWIFKC